MKKFRYSYLLLAGGLLWSCGPGKPGSTILAIESDYNSELYSMTLDSLGFRESNRVSITPNEVTIISFDHKYSTEIRLESSLISNHLRLYMKPGDSLLIRIGNDQRQGYFFEISGDDTWFQNYLLAKDNNSQERQSSLANYKERVRFDEDLYKYDSLVDWTLSLSLQLKEFQSTSSLDTSKIRGLLTQLLSFDPIMKKSVDFNNLIYDLQGLFITLNQWQNDQMIEQDLVALTANRIQRLQIHPFLREWMYALLISQISEYGLDGDLGMEYKRFITSQNSPMVFVNALKERAKPWNNLTKGSDAPDFTMLTREGNSVNLSGFFGQYLYIDIWAGWCKPCIEEFPHSISAMKDPRFSEFRFLFVNMDSDQDRWQRALEVFGVPDGIHLYLPGEWDNELFSKYNQTALPRYLIIDPQGKIINTHAPRPSQREKILTEVQEASL